MTMRANASVRELAQQFLGISTSTIGNVLDSLRINAIMPGLRPVVLPMRMAGVAFTVKAVVGKLGDYMPGDFSLGDVIDNLQAGDVVVIDLGGQEVASWGGLAALAAKLRGAAGLAVHGGVRDIDEIMNCGFPVYSRHVTPLSPRTRVKIVGLNLEICIGDVQILPQDIIVGDSTGLVRVPANIAREVLDEVLVLNKKDDEAMRLIRDGGSFKNALSAIRNGGAS
ncbi:MenG Demethylmenaquinone methyltransferase [Burkholderiaceae bacterium]